ncbi:hypothetical protein DICSQDRAFT_140237 [Dichomitus squalens LYAD-421 SS1]|uniref:Uncharacterized protein n=1 Tax=Dichomitus squalens (strain LYAD-421) TaxID=732165 RepID=R7SRW2_DICSQ|nr:uncharacterized protein DICSQDRAFT_140237 [Dichomitus squalens LYAD-421 SS1]EJF57682.1 hypothetical protein DICSQDRAFT_140237 [Dichomitus squalens LYAD-421 SS1]
MFVKPNDALNTIVEKVVIKSFVIWYDNSSPTRNKAQAIKMMFEASEFIEEHKDSIQREDFQHLVKLTKRFDHAKQNTKTRWRDLAKHPIKTYNHARELRGLSNQLMDDAMTASARGKVERAERERRAAAEAHKTEVAKSSNNTQSPRAPPNPAIIAPTGSAVHTANDLPPGCPQAIESRQVPAAAQAGVPLRISTPNGHVEFPANIGITATYHQGYSVFKVIPDTQNPAQASEQKTIRRSVSIYSVTQTKRVVTSNRSKKRHTTKSHTSGNESENETEGTDDDVVLGQQTASEELEVVKLTDEEAEAFEDALEDFLEASDEFTVQGFDETSDTPAVDEQADASDCTCSPGPQ